MLISIPCFPGLYRKEQHSPAETDDTERDFGLMITLVLDFDFELINVCGQATD